MAAEHYTLDEKDFSILRLLQKDAKMSVRDISAIINLSPTPTHERIKRMEKSGVIKEYTAVVDRKKVNKGMMVICMIALNVHNKKTAGKFIEEVSRLKEVVEFYNISGDFDFMLKILAPNMDEFHEFFIGKLSEIEGIGQTKSIFVMSSIKESAQIL
ncbi:Lrp/AsnC family transcriptional regulator [Chryseobacterium indologenes]|uniref:Lrp/AsnC family transcriptional regulator n=1 Tax=Chryseobacterium indologenes TaxID=253 RepID=UPI000F512D87|nr:Lrp/AsnC family transcriptional regulator [Chryseobacterium indologenes]AYZ34954.1 Lrp/AsnC family transcriptional regulator [Chryseobacterium indologenes]MBF6643697.1 Lrp/AsnC family transcriptional regulator [Chryseobacterium indologenes]MBU3050068.1 Lrp/AsnC family transcriptional regulator [Chryseobacterium indologenes]MEB4761604.1 Lrp/AsnC family transcriptional regulator [Chryseobacterium indologenes]QQQ72569.1 Lrp/AsnC family transcriptional regulator [Chryseobacterium indologenes]